MSAAAILDRRSLMLGCGATLVAGQPLISRGGRAQPLPVPISRSLAFQVHRKGSVIGLHAITFEGDAQNVTVKVAVELHIGLGPIVLFRYRHNAAEVWKDGRLWSVESETDDDGQPFKMRGWQTPAGFIVEGTKAKRYVAPADALPATHWNLSMLNGPIINTQDGSLLEPSVTRLGIEPIPAASGATIDARHFALTGQVTLDTWYDLESAWAGILFQAIDHSEVRYERI